MTKNNSLQNWKENALKELKKQDIEAIIVETPEGINIKPLYTELDNKEIKHLGSNPGEAPYVRGPKATMYTGRTAPFIVMETDILSRGIPSKRIFISSTLSIATPALPTSP